MLVDAWAEPRYDEYSQAEVRLCTITIPKDALGEYGLSSYQRYDGGAFDTEIQQHDWQCLVNVQDADHLTFRHVTRDYCIHALTMANCLVAMMWNEVALKPRGPWDTHRDKLLTTLSHVLAHAWGAKTTVQVKAVQWPLSVLPVPVHRPPTVQLHLTLDPTDTSIMEPALEREANNETLAERQAWLPFKRQGQ